jgi:hypothetical protein
MANARFDSLLAKKLNTFVALSRDELKCLAGLQSNPVKVKRGQQPFQSDGSGQAATTLKQAAINPQTHNKRDDRLHEVERVHADG